MAEIEFEDSSITSISSKQTTKKEKTGLYIRFKKLKAHMRGVRLKQILAKQEEAKKAKKLMKYQTPLRSKQIDVDCAICLENFCDASELRRTHVCKFLNLLSYMSQNNISLLICWSLLFYLYFYNKIKKFIITNLQNLQITIQKIIMQKLLYTVSIDEILSYYLQLHDDPESTLIFNKILSVVRGSFQYVVNQFVRQIRLEQIPKKAEIIENVQQYLDNEELDFIQKRQLQLDLQVLVFAITQIPNVYTKFFPREFFLELDKHDILDQRINLNWFQDKIHELIINHLIKVLGTKKGNLYEMVIQQINLDVLIKLLNNQMAQLFNDSSDNLKKIVEQFIFDTDSTPLANRYLVTGLFQELSNRSYDLVRRYLNMSLYIYTTYEEQENIAKIIINHFDHLQLYVNQHEAEFKTPLQQIILSYSHKNLDELEAIGNLLQDMVQKDEKVILHKIIRKSDFKVGLLIEVEGDKELRFVIHKPQDRVIITYAKLVQHLWVYEGALLNRSDDELIQYIKETQTEYSSIEHAFNSLKFQQSISKIQDGDYDIKNEQISFISGNMQANQVSSAFGESMENVRPANQFEFNNDNIIRGGTFQTAVGDIGASLGICLANINKYESKKEFLKDFGSTAAISGSISYLATQMPLIGQLVALGGFGYFSMKIYTNNTASQQSKQSMMNKLVIGTTANIGSGIGGALIGQALIPVPIVGALIGGMIGGFLGGVSGNKYCEFITQKKYQDIYEKLKESFNKHWEYSEDLVDYLGISQDFFQKGMPDNLTYDQDRNLKWINMVCYTFCTVYQQQLDNENGIQEDFPEFIDGAIQWIIEQKCIITLALSNLENTLKCIFQNQ